MRIEDAYPLPVPVDERTDHTQWIPDVEDETGNAAMLWEIMCNLRLATGKWAGERFGDHCQPWQKKLVWALAGPRPDDPQQLFWVSELYFECAKKGGKSAFFSLLMLAIALAFPRPDGRIILLAGSKQQADLIYTPIKSAIEQDAGLLKLANVRDYKRDVVFYETQATIRTIALDIESVTGLVPDPGYYVDEVHVATRNRKAALMIRQLSSGLAVTGGLALYTTTKPIAGEPASGIFSMLRNRALSILEGRHEAAPETLLPVIFEPAPGQDLDDPRHWWRSQPGLDHTVSLAWLKQQHSIAKAEPDPTLLDDFRSQLLNAFVESSSAGIDGWTVARHWSQWVDASITLDRLLAESTEVFVGADAGGQDDLSAMVVIGRSAAGRYLVWSRAWLTRHGYETWPKNQALYDEAQKTGELVITDAAGEDIEEIFDLLGEISPLIVGVDPYGLQDLARRCEESRIEVVGVPQGYRISPHLEGAERGFFADQIRVCSGPLLRWCVSNMRLKDRGGAKAVVKPSGESSGAEKIDLGIALLLAWAMTTQDSTASIYHDESRAMIM